MWVSAKHNDTNSIPVHWFLKCACIAIQQGWMFSLFIKTITFFQTENVMCEGSGNTANERADQSSQVDCAIRKSNDLLIFV